ncbi:MAG: hypothetical protein QOI20_1550 [Acidimicrobiaceae bacterium]|jgi:hypothetical protein|nr:hypothetical protein [Acidimicrobiaceae bacterium]
MVVVTRDGGQSGPGSEWPAGAGAALSEADPAGAASRHARDTTSPGLVLAAVLSLAAGAIHFAFAPEHFAEHASHGAFFLGLGLFQVGWAVWALLRPGRLVAAVGLLNLAVVGVWLVSRTAGLPGEPVEAVGFPDALASAVEVGVVGLGLMALVRGVGRPRLRAPVVAVVATVATALTLVSLTPAAAGGHHHHEAASAPAHDGAGHVATPASGSAAGTSPCERAGPPASPAQVTDSEGHFHRGSVPQQPIDAGTRLVLAGQQALARAAAARYPTVADATRSGYRLSTGYTPCIGAHFTNIGLVARFDPAAPSELLFDGTTPSAKLVGLSYLVYHPGGAPVGFAGPNDVWHQHNANGGLCFSADGVVIAGEQASARECAALGGAKRELTDVWMLHEWVVPGWECSWDVFAPECPELGGRVGRSAWD